MIWRHGKEFVKLREDDQDCCDVKEGIRKSTKKDGKERNTRIPEKDYRTG